METNWERRNILKVGATGAAPEESSYVTGVDIVVDGGMKVW